jgi:hypothetical protein
MFSSLLLAHNCKGGQPVGRADPRASTKSKSDPGKVWISYNSPEYLKERHALPQNLLSNIAVVETLATAAGE